MTTYQSKNKTWDLHILDHTVRDLTYTPEFIEYTPLGNGKLRVKAEYDIAGPIPDGAVEIMAHTTLDHSLLVQKLIDGNHESISQFDEVRVSDTDPGVPYITPLCIDGIVMHTGHIVFEFDVDLETYKTEMVWVHFDEAFDSTVLMHFEVTSTQDDIRETHTAEIRSHTRLGQSDFLEHSGILGSFDNLFEVVPQ